ncbi:MAG: sugar phosphate nucleotidyltransferase [Pseudomonadota bacterium]
MAGPTSHAIILAGGSGTRLWPLSRSLYPKQLIDLGHGRTLLQATLERVMRCFAVENIHIVTNVEHVFEVREQAMAMDEGLVSGIVAEPCVRSTLPAVLLGLDAAWEMERNKAVHLEKSSQFSDDTSVNTVYDIAPNIAVFPSDHVVGPVVGHADDHADGYADGHADGYADGYADGHADDHAERWMQAMECAQGFAQSGHFVTFGIAPTKAETGYGYILRGEGHLQASTHDDDRLGFGVVRPNETGARPYARSHPHARPYTQGHPRAYAVKSFVEKPDLATATQYLAHYREDGRYLWNSGMFFFHGDAFLQSVANHQKSLWDWWQARHEVPLVNSYHTLPSVSLDRGIMELAIKDRQVTVIESNFAWDDLGSFEALHRFEAKDSAGCVVQGDTMNLDCRDSLLLSRSGKLVGIGLTNMIVVQTRDATLVCPRHKAQFVKDAVDMLKAELSPLTDVHVTVRRPWGSYTVLEAHPSCKIKRITVHAGACLSLQMHHHRSEHWVVVRGAALVEINGEQMLCTENQWAVIPCGVQHRLSNPGKISLELIEIQRGSYLEEDDIVRFDDVYGRVHEA